MPANIYQGMIAPLVGYGVRGTIWYQGESNANGPIAHDYEELLGCMVRDWRKRWGSEMSFYYVQLANYEDAKRGDKWVVVQDEQRRAMKSIKDSGMAVINDIGNATNIHPTNKIDVGERLARWALAKDYGNENIVYSGPLFQKAQKKDGKMMVSFEHNAGLKTRDGEALGGFEVRGKKGEWLPAQAEIQEGAVVAWSDEVPKPTEVRYAWAMNPVAANLVNSDDLPTSCFTTESASKSAKNEPTE